MTTTRVDATLRREAVEFSFHFGCRSCAHFVPEAEACAHGYPTEPHRDLDLGEVTELEFCKEFELA